MIELSTVFTSISSEKLMLLGTLVTPVVVGVGSLVYYIAKDEREKESLKPAGPEPK